MNIGSQAGYPASKLSNFSGNRFTIDGVECYSMEGFLQALKFKNPEMQVEVCKLVGKAAKFKGKPKKWYREQVLHWKGTTIPRKSKEYQKLLDRAFQAMYDDSKSFRDALEVCKGVTFTHSMGKSNESETVLTNTEFLSRLTKLRDYGHL